MSADPVDGLRPGIRVMRGSNFMIPAGGLVISMGEDGAPSIEIREVLLTTSTWLDWLHIAFERLDDVRAARRDLDAAVRSGDDEAESDPLERELRSSLQVVSAAASGLEGFYGLIQPHVKVTLEEVEARRRKRTGRAIWVWDAVSKSARIPSKVQPVLRKNIVSTYKARNLAVHPEDAPRRPGIHHGLRQMVPYYVATFSLESAAGVVATCVEAIMWVLDRPRATQGPIFDLSQSGSAMLHELVDARFTFAPGSCLKPRTAER
jgi:hypothetical protein